MFWSDTRGNVTTLFALSLIPLLAAAGAAIDYATALRQHTDLQAAVDAAALSAVSAKNETQQSAANKAFARNLGVTGCSATPQLTTSGNQVTVTASCEIETTLMNVFGVGTVRLDATASAHRAAGRSLCMIALHSNDKESVMINSDSAIVAPDCEIQINSTNSEALRGNSNGDITSKKNCLSGGWVRDNSSQFTPVPETCSSVADPLASLPVPAEATASCTRTDFKVTGARTLNPGVYCGKFEIDSGAVVTFNPGIYVVRNGEFIVNSNSRLRGDDVMIYLTGNNNARFNFNSGSQVQLRAPRTGTYAGIAIFQQRGSTADFSILNSDSTSFIEGVIYLPSTPLHLNSYGELAPDAPWTMVISSKLEVNSHSVLRLNADYDASNVPLPNLIKSANATGKVRLVR